MRGVGTARGAITVVNALPTGIGSAIGIELPVRAEVELETVARNSTRPEIEPRSSATPLVEESVRRAEAEFADPGLAVTKLTVRSEIPPARGLKSSSAVASAIVLAVARAAGRQPLPVEVAAISAGASRSAGASATGAFDDALAGLTAGLVITDNVHDRPIRVATIDSDLEVGLWIPTGTHPASPQTLGAFRAEAGAAHRAVEAVLAEDWPRAMDLNSELVERVMGYREYGRLRAGARRLGALAAGASGLGPSFALVAPPSAFPEVLSVLPRGDGEVRRVSLHNGSSGSEVRGR